MSHHVLNPGGAPAGSDEWRVVFAQKFGNQPAGKAISAVDDNRSFTHGGVWLRRENEVSLPAAGLPFSDPAGAAPHQAPAVPARLAVANWGQARKTVDQYTDSRLKYLYC
jgi:hypothetical protein